VPHPPPEAPSTPHVRFNDHPIEVPPSPVPSSSAPDPALYNGLADDSERRRHGDRRYEHDHEYASTPSRSRATKDRSFDADRDRDRDRDRGRDSKRDRKGKRRRDDSADSAASDETIELPPRFDEYGRPREEDPLAEKLESVLKRVLGA